MAHLPSTFMHSLKVSNAFSHAGQAVAVAFGPDSRLLALGGGVKATVDLWDSHRATQVGELSGHRPSWLVKTIGSLAFSPDGRLLASGSGDKTVRLWRTSDGESVNVLTGFAGQVDRLAFHPTAPVLAAADRDAVRLFDLGSGAALPVQLPGGGINAVAFSPDGSLLAMAADGAARRGAYPVALVDPADGRIVRTVGDGELPARALAFSPDGQLLATCRSGSNVRIYR